MTNKKHIFIISTAAVLLFTPLGVTYGAVFNSNQLATSTPGKGKLLVPCAATGPATWLATSTNGKVLTASSSAGCGVSWETPTAGAGSGTFNASSNPTEIIFSDGTNHGTSTGNFFYQTSTDSIVTLGSFLNGTTTKPTNALEYVATSSPILYVGTDGRIGVGTSTPDTLFVLNDPNNATGTILTLRQGSMNGEVYVAATNPKMVVGTRNSQPLYFETAGTLRANFSSAGYFTMSTTTAYDLFAIATGTRIFSVNATSGTVTANYSLAVGSAALSANIIAGFGTSTMALNVKDNGFVGIGTTNPSDKLHISGGDILLTDGRRLGWGAGPSARIVGSDSSDVIAIVTNNATNTTFTATGVGIGNSTPTGIFQVSSSIIYASGTTGFVGIGTSTPDSSFVIASGTKTFGVNTNTNKVTIPAITNSILATDGSGNIVATTTTGGGQNLINNTSTPTGVAVTNDANRIQIATSATVSALGVRDVLHLVYNGWTQGGNSQINNRFELSCNGTNVLDTSSSTGNITEPFIGTTNNMLFVDLYISNQNSTGTQAVQGHANLGSTSTIMIAPSVSTTTANLGTSFNCAAFYTIPTGGTARTLRTEYFMLEKLSSS